MKEYPILFRANMVRAILGDHKTQTRRNIPQDAVVDGVLKPGYRLPYGKEGDLIWVREVWRVGAWKDNPGRIAVDYAADGWPRAEWIPLKNEELYCRLRDQSYAEAIQAGHDPAKGWEPGHGPLRWRRSIHMPKAVCRIWLRNTGVRVERLQDITDADALQEGVPRDDDYPHYDEAFCRMCDGTGLHGAVGSSLGYMEVDCRECDTPRKRFRNLWDYMYERDIEDEERLWVKNPYVMVVNFEVEEMGSW